MKKPAAAPKKKGPRERDLLKAGIPGVRQRPYHPREQKHEPTPLLRQRVTMLAELGWPNPVIAKVVGITQRTLERHYRHELTNCRDIVYAKIGLSILEQASREVNPDKTMQIFVAKTRMGWSERHTTSFAGADGNVVNPAELFTINITG